MNQFDRTIATMMKRFGTTAAISVATGEKYNPATSENVVFYVEYPVNVLVFDYIDKTSGVGTEQNKLIQSGDKQVFVQPPNKTANGLPLPHLSPNRDRLKLNDKLYRIVALKQLNPSMTNEGCVMYELYVRE